MDKLKRCPICRRRPSIGKGGPGGLVWYIACDTQDDHVVTVHISGTREAAVARWNRRPGDAMLMEVIRDMDRVRAAARALLEDK